MKRWLFPIPLKKLNVTSDSRSYQNIDITKECEIPVAINAFDDLGRQHHFGAFGSKRRHNIHKGVDLYCPNNTPVYAVEDSICVQIRPFTGYKVGTDEYWNDTEALSAVGESGLIVYGEIVPDYHHQVGKSIRRGELIGWVKRVLKEDKGRPTSMLHIELHAHHQLHTDDKWPENQPLPDGLKDPTNDLIESEENPNTSN